MAFQTQGSNARLSPHIRDSALILAAQHGDTDRVRRALDSGADVGFRHSVDTLGKQRWDIVGNVSPLMLAASSGCLECVRLIADQCSPDLINAMDSVGNTALHHAVTAEIARELVDRGAFKDMRNERDETPVFYQINGMPKCLDPAVELVRMGAPIDELTEDPFDIEKTESLDLIDALIDRGWGINDSSGWDGLSVLMLAASVRMDHDRSMFIRGLLDRGADPFQRPGDNPNYQESRDPDRWSNSLDMARRVENEPVLTVIETWLSEQALRGHAPLSSRASCGVQSL